MPNAATDTAIAVFETNKLQGSQEAVFTEIADDGFVLSKSKGRTDAYGKWDSTRKKLLRSLDDPDSHTDGETLVKTRIHQGSEWGLQAYANIDYANLNSNDFLSVIKKRLVYVAKRDLGLLEEYLDEITLIEAIGEYYGQSFRKNDQEKVDTSNWVEFKFKEVFKRQNGARLTKQDMAIGTTNFIGAVKGNNGVRDHKRKPDLPKSLYFR